MRPRQNISFRKEIYVCLSCRNEYSVYRQGRFRPQFHPKKIFCPFCRQEKTHIQISEFILEKFKNNEIVLDKYIKNNYF